MAKETTVEIDIEVSTKYTEQLKKAEERIKKVNKVTSKINTPKKPITEMEKYQQSINRTNKLLQRLEKIQNNFGKSIKLETVINAKVKVTEVEEEKKKGLYEKVKGAIDSADEFIELPSKLSKYPVIGKLFQKGSGNEESGSEGGESEGANMFDVIKNVGSKIPKIYSGINSKLASGLQNTGNTIDKIFKGIGPTTSKIVEKFKTGIGSAGSGIKNLFLNMGNINFTGMFQNMYSGLKGTLSGLGNGVKSGLINAISSAKTGITGAFRNIISFDYIGMFKGIGPGILNGIKGIGPGISGMFSGIGGGISGAFSALASINPLAIILVLVGAFVLLYMKCESFRKVVNEAFQKIMPHIMALAELIQGVVCAVFQELLSIFNQLKPALFSMLQKGKPLFEMLVNAIIVAIKIIIEVIQYLVPIFAQIWEAIKPIVMIALEVIIALIGAAIETITFILQLLVDIFQAVWAAISPIVMFAIDIIVGLITGLIETISFIIQGLIVIITLVWEQIKPIFQSGIEVIVGMWNGFKEFMSGFWSGLVSGIQGFVDSFREKISAAVDWVKEKLSGLASSIPGLDTVINIVKGKNYSGTNYWQGGLTYVGERGRELIQYPTGERFMAEAKMLMNLPKGTKIFTNSKTEKALGRNVPRDKMTTVDENNQLRKLGGFNGLSGYTDHKFGGGNYNTNVQTDNITINITNTYGNQSPNQIKDTNTDLVRKINEVLFQNKDRQRRVSIG